MIEIKMNISENFVGGMIVLGVLCYFAAVFIKYMKEDR
tara:strand:+ start:1116 stop:1229 length:114 start_codon:yes stop_codon:yes gene_type:complete